MLATAHAPEDVGFADHCGADIWRTLRLSCWRFSYVSYVYFHILQIHGFHTWLPLCVVTTCRPRLSLSVPILIGTNFGNIGEKGAKKKW